MKILFCGLGSIGQRHLRNIKRLYGDEHEIMAFRVGHSQRTFSDDMKIRDGVSLEEEYHIKVFDALDKALNEKPNVVYVTNVTSKHMETAIAAVKADCDVFIEKPLSDSLDGIGELINTAKANDSIVYVGYQNRYHPCISDIKKELECCSIGNILSVDSEFSERLVTMHTYEDYSGTYMARKDLGGGPVLNLQIHVLDYLQWIFGKPVNVFSVSGNKAGLKVDVEDLQSSLFSFMTDDGSVIPVYCHTDFLQFPPAHRIKIVGSKGRVEADFNAAETVIFSGDEKRVIDHSDFIRNDMFIEELKDFMECVKSRKQPNTGIEEALISLRMALGSKISAEENRQVKMEELKI